MKNYFRDEDGFLYVHGAPQVPRGDFQTTDSLDEFESWFKAASARITALNRKLKEKNNVQKVA